MAPSKKRLYSRSAETFDGFTAQEWRDKAQGYEAKALDLETQLARRQEDTDFHKRNAASLREQLVEATSDRTAMVVNLNQAQADLAATKADLEKARSMAADLDAKLAERGREIQKRDRQLSDVRDSLKAMFGESTADAARRVGALLALPNVPRLTASGYGKAVEKVLVSYVSSKLGSPWDGDGTQELADQIVPVFAPLSASLEEAQASLSRVRENLAAEPEESAEEASRRVYSQRQAFYAYADRLENLVVRVASAAGKA